MFIIFGITVVKNNIVPYTMMNKISFIVIILLCAGFNSFSQARMTFQNSEHDFGNVSEGTMATHDFMFTNTGSEPLLIQNVKASCGCTTPYWTKEPILPGKQGKITASYDSKNRPGAFNKSISITSNAQEPNVTLYIKGVVISMENVEKVFTDEEIANSPKVFVDKELVQLGKIGKGQHVPFTFEVKNTGKSDLKVSQVKAPCNCIALDGAAVPIKPGKSEQVKLIYRAILPGLRKEQLTFYTNDITNPESKIQLEAEVVENLSNESIIKEKSSTFTF